MKKAAEITNAEIQEALDQNGGKQARAARALGISMSTVRRVALGDRKSGSEMEYRLNRRKKAQERWARIRELLKTGMKQSDIAREVGCTSALVSDVKMGRVGHAELKPKANATKHGRKPITKLRKRCKKCDEGWVIPPDRFFCKKCQTRISSDCLGFDYA